MLVSKIKPCKSKYKQLYCETANGSNAFTDRIIPWSVKFSTFLMFLLDNWDKGSTLTVDVDPSGPFNP